ncbi:MAG: hypothetical protein LBU60_02995 [Clostridiales bacterium]|jgi:hypothetical protein|nr:hypothetical protein [Clostridiales bacterium]
MVNNSKTKDANSKLFGWCDGKWIAIIALSVALVFLGSFSLYVLLQTKKDDYEGR